MEPSLRSYLDVRKQYSRIIDNAWWGKLIADKTDVYLKRYMQGEIIFDASPPRDEKKPPSLSPYRFPLTIILEGRAEIFESYEVGGFFRKPKSKAEEEQIRITAYRPIRILRERDIFGEFEVLDNCLGLALGSLEGERWKICAGVRSIWITGECKNCADYFHEFQEYDEDGDIVNENIHVHRLLDKYLDCPTTVAVIDGESIHPGNEFYFKLLEYSWSRAKMYRDCLNSFNYRKLLKFKKLGDEVMDSLKKSKLYDLSDKTDIKLLAPLFIDAIWDACNRPLRCEPMFSKLPLAFKSDFDISSIGLDASEILSATDSFDNECFWFPIDLTNYMLASHFEKNSHSLAKNFGWLNVKGGKQEKKTPYEFYMVLANKLLDGYNKSSTYPYIVKCLPVKGLGRNHLALMFSKKF